MMAVGASIGLFIIWFILMVGSIVAIAYVTIALWRSMMAFQSIADSMKDIAESFHNQIRKEETTNNEGLNKL